METIREPVLQRQEVFHRSSWSQTVSVAPPCGSVILFHQPAVYSPVFWSLSAWRRCLQMYMSCPTTIFILANQISDAEWLTRYANKLITTHNGTFLLLLLLLLLAICDNLHVWVWLHFPGKRTAVVCMYHVRLTNHVSVYYNCTDWPITWLLYNHTDWPMRWLLS